MAICFEQSSMRYCTCGQKSSGIKTLMKKVFRARDPVEAKVLRHQVSDFEEKFSKRIVTSGYSNRPSINLFNPTGYLNSFCQPARNTWLKQQSIPLFNLISCQLLFALQISLPLLYCLLCSVKLHEPWPQLSAKTQSQ